MQAVSAKTVLPESGLGACSQGQSPGPPILSCPGPLVPLQICQEVRLLGTESLARAWLGQEPRLERSIRALGPLKELESYFLGSGKPLHSCKQGLLCVYLTSLSG